MSSQHHIRKDAGISGFSIIIVLAVTATVAVMGMQVYTAINRYSLFSDAAGMQDKTVPFDEKYEDAAIGHARLVDEIGFMHMDLGQLGNYFATQVHYQADVYAYQSWKLPSLFVSEKGGDCEDYMLFALAVLDHQAYDLRPVLGTFNGGGHAFLLAQDATGVHLVDNIGNVREIGTEAWDDMDRLPSPYIADRVYSDMLEGVFA